MKPSPDPVLRTACLALLTVQNNLACTHHKLGRLDEAMRVRQDVYSRRLELSGEEGRDTILAANNYAASLRISFCHIILFLLRLLARVNRLPGSTASDKAVACARPQCLLPPKIDTWLAGRGWSWIIFWLFLAW